MKLHLEDIADILDTLPENHGAVLVGGQALNLWAEYYAIQDPEIRALEPFFSADVDFIGTREDAEHMNRTLGGTLRIPDMDTHTIMTAKIDKKTKGGEDLQIDFMESILGVESHDLKRDAVTVKEPNGNRNIKLLHPGHCLSSRVHNTYGILERRRRKDGHHHIERTMLALKIMKRYLQDQFKTPVKEKHRPGYNWIEHVTDLATSTAGMKAWKLDNIDLIECMPIAADLTLSEQYRTHRYPRILDHINQKRSAFLKRGDRGGQDTGRTPDEFPEPET